ncbi:MAG: DUF6427 family protein [Bacteroidales bacterium]|nr:DUF6427 family protein [Bacteroidales bacterium]
MFKLLKSYQPANLLLIIFITIALFLKYFLDAGTGLDTNTETYSIYKWVIIFFNYIDSPLTNKIITFILILFEALFFTIISNHYNLIGKRSYLPMLIYLLIILNSIGALEISATLFANILFLGAWVMVKKAGGKKHALSNYFNASILIGIASIFYFNYIYLLIILWINLLIIRGARVREFILSILGAATVWYFVFFFFYLNNLSFLGFTQKFQANTGLNDFSVLSLSVKIIRLYIIALFALSILSLFKYFNNLKIDIRNNFKLLFTLFVLGLLLVVLTNSSFEMVHLIAIPISLFISNYLISIKKEFWSNIFLGGLILLTVFNIYFGFLLN